MRIWSRSLLFSLFVAAPALAQAKKNLEPMDMFRLDFLMVADAEQPLGWLDAEHYLVFDEGRSARGRQAPSWSRVHARTGNREAHVDAKKLRSNLEAAVGGGEPIDEAIDEALAVAATWTWDESHSRFVLDIANDLWLGALDGMVVRLTTTPEAESCVQFSPDASRVAWVARDNLYAASTADAVVRALTTEGHDELFFGRLDWVYQEELYGRGNFQGFWWSPDNRHIALLRLDESPVQEFVLVNDTPARPEVEKTNYPKAGEANPNVDLGILDVVEGSVRWCGLDDYPLADRLIVRVTWVPDGSEVLFQLQNRTQTWLDMMAVASDTGVVARHWREDSDCWVEAGPEPRWLADGSYLWLSERDGFRHVYHYARDGKLLGQLTRGEWQVRDIVAVDDDKRCAFVLADRDSPLQTHLYRLPFGSDGAAAELQRITKGDGTHDVTMAPGNELFVTDWSNIRTPPSVFVRDLQDQEVRVVARAKTEMMSRFALPTPEFVQVPTQDGFLMEAMLLKPADFDAEKKYPVVQHTYSGPHAPLVRDQWGGLDLLWHHLLAQRGYVVFVCDNRSASGKGRKYARSCWQQLGRSELSDLEDSVVWLSQQSFVDAGRVALWGWSYGGYQTLYNLTHSKTWKCGVAVNAVTDWRNYDTIYAERYAGLPADHAAAYERSSVVAAAKDLSAPLLLVAAAMDDNVHMQNSLQFLYALQKAGKDCDFVVYPRVRHGIEDLQLRLHLYARFERFLKEHL